MKLICLGTGHADVIKNYNTCFVLENGRGALLVDAGGGNRILSQLDKCRLDINKLNFGFVTHCHTDHLLGFVWVIRIGIMLNFLKGIEREPFNLFGSKICLNAIETICKVTIGEKVWGKLIENKKLILKEVVDGQHERIYGMDFEFFDTKAVEKDFPQMGFFIKEKGFVFAGDVPLSEHLYQKFQGQKTLCLEAFCVEKQREIFLIQLKKHRTAGECGVIAEKLKAENLILWHGEDDLDGTRKEQYLNEAKKYFSGKVFAPDDLDIIEGL